MAESNILGLDNILPLLMQKKQQKDAEAKKQGRIDQITQLHRVLDTSKSKGERRDAVTRLSAMGVAVPESMVNPKPDLKPFFDSVNAPNYIRQVFNETDIWYKRPLEVFKMAIKEGDDAELNVGDMQSIIDTGALDGTPLEGRTAEEIFGMKMFGDQFGQGASNKLFMGEAEKPTKQESVFKVMHDDQGGILPLSEIVSDPERMAELNTLGVSPEEIRGIYGTDPKLLSQARGNTYSRIKEQYLTAKYGLGQALADWAQGNTAGLEEGLIKEFDKNFDKETLQLKDKAVLEAYDKEFELSLKAAGESFTPAGDAPSRSDPPTFKEIKKLISASGPPDKESDKEFEFTREEIQDPKLAVEKLKKSGFTKAKMQTLLQQAIESGQPLIWDQATFEQIMELLPDE